jgi:hypothetical protein
VLFGLQGCKRRDFQFFGCDRVPGCSKIRLKICVFYNPDFTRKKGGFLHKWCKICVFTDL